MQTCLFYIEKFHDIKERKNRSVIYKHLVSWVKLHFLKIAVFSFNIFNENYIAKIVMCEEIVPTDCVNCSIESK